MKQKAKDTVDTLALMTMCVGLGMIIGASGATVLAYGVMIKMGL